MSSKALPEQEFWSPPQLAARLGCTADAVISLIRSGQLKASNISQGRKPRFKVSEVDFQAFLEKRTVVPVATPHEQPRNQQSHRRRRPPGWVEYF